MLLSALPTSVKDWANAEKTAVWGVENGMKAPIELPDREQYRPRYINGHDDDADPPEDPGSGPEDTTIGNNVVSCVQVSYQDRQMMCPQDVLLS